MQKAHGAAPRAQAQQDSDANGPDPRVKTPRRPGLVLARRAQAAFSSARSRLGRPSDAPPMRSRLSGARPALRFGRSFRLDSPERIVPVLVAAFLLVASITAAPGFVAPAGATGGTYGAGDAPRLVIGGASGPNDGYVGAAANVTGAPSYLGIDQGAGPVDGGSAVATEVAGQFLADGTLLKPVVVTTTVNGSAELLRTYRVRSGDTLTGIARRMGVSMMTIWWANHLRSKDSLKVGQVLVIPPVTGLVVTVKSGDTLGSIAAANKLSALDVATYNGLALDTTLVIGQVLILPGAQSDAIATPKPTPQPVAVRPRVVTSGGSRAVSGPVARPPAQYSGGTFAWPVAGGYISQYFWAGHLAIDIAADWGTPVKAAAPGTVIYAGWKDNGGGYQVWIAHGSDLFTTYNHMSSVAVSVGEHVGRAEFIGRIGATGNATGPHLHFEVWRGPVWNGGYRVNPLAYL